MNRTRTAMIAVRKLSTGIGDNCGKKKLVVNKRGINVDTMRIVSGDAERPFRI